MKVAIIPARGGSKRIPRKNVKRFGGKPMIAHSIAAAQASGVFDRIIVSTDDEEIARISRQYGAEVPFMRPAALADDHAGTTEVVAHAVNWLHLAAPDAVCCIYATAPFVDPQDLRQGLKLIESGAWDYAFSATTFPYPIFRAFRRDPVEMFFVEHFTSRSQDLPEAWHDAGQFYWGTPRAWTSGAMLFSRRSMIVPVPRSRVQDIDTPEDWERAELMWHAMHMHVAA